MANADEWGRGLCMSSLVMIITEDAEVNHKKLKYNTFLFTLQMRIACTCTNSFRFVEKASIWCYKNLRV